MTDPRFYNANSIDGFDDECKVNDSTGSVTLIDGEVTEKILNFFMRKGLNVAQASAIVGNMMQESGLEPAKIQGGRVVKPDENYILQSGVGFGLVQWTFGGPNTPGSRQTSLQEHVDKMGVKNTDLGGQLSFVWEELNSGYLSTLNKLKSVDNTAEGAVEGAIIVHDGYESSADTPEAVRTVRGGNAKGVFNTNAKKPALAGAAAPKSLNNPSGEEDPDSTKSDLPASLGVSNSKGCTESGFSGGNFDQTLKAYAWDTYKGNTVEARQEYTDATKRNRAAGLYVGGISYPGIDCGGFVTQLIRDSGYDKKYNYDGKGGATATQEKWAKENWQYLGSGESIDPAKLQKGDVAISSSHTYVYIGDGVFKGAKVASASLDERAPMADTQQSVTQSGFNWYSKK